MLHEYLSVTVQEVPSTPGMVSGINGCSSILSTWIYSARIVQHMERSQSSVALSSELHARVLRLFDRLCRGNTNTHSLERCKVVISEWGQCISNNDMDFLFVLCGAAEDISGDKWVEFWTASKSSFENTG